MSINNKKTSDIYSFIVMLRCYFLNLDEEQFLQSQATYISLFIIIVIIIIICLIIAII